MLQFQQFVFRGLKPVKIAINGHVNSHGTDESCGIIITYAGGKMAVLSVSARIDLPNEGLIVGTKGKLLLPDYWCPTKMITSKGLMEWQLPESPKPYHHHNSGCLIYELEEVRRCILAGK